MTTWLLALAAVWAQEVPLAAPRAVLSLDASTACPTVPDGFVPGIVSTTVGLANHRGDGTFTWVCPSHWGGSWEPEVAADPTGDLLVVVADGRVFQSTDGGCRFANLLVPDAGVVPTETFWWRDGAWVVGLDEADRSTALYRVQGDQLDRLATLRGLLADDVAPGDASTLWAVGMRPAPGAYRLAFAGGLAGADVLLTDLPPTDRVASLTVGGADDDEAWVLARRGTSTGVWFAQHEPSGVTLWEEALDDNAAAISARFVLGPVLYDGVWVALFDNALYSAGQLTGGFFPVGSQATWTGMQRVGGQLFASSPTELLAVPSFDGDLNPVTEAVFALPQLVAPNEACFVEGCPETWAAVSQALSFDPEAEPAICPDGTRLSDLEPASCNCASGGGAPAGVLALGVGLLAWRRRR